MANEITPMKQQKGGGARGRCASDWSEAKTSGRGDSLTDNENNDNVMVNQDDEFDEEIFTTTPRRLNTACDSGNFYTIVIKT